MQIDNSCSFLLAVFLITNKLHQVGKTVPLQVKLVVYVNILYRFFKEKIETLKVCKKQRAKEEWKSSITLLLFNLNNT